MIHSQKQDIQSNAYWNFSLPFSWSQSQSVSSPMGSTKTVLYKSAMHIFQYPWRESFIFWIYSTRFELSSIKPKFLYLNSTSPSKIAYRLLSVSFWHSKLEFSIVSHKIGYFPESPFPFPTCVNGTLHCSSDSKHRISLLVSTTLMAIYFLQSSFFGLWKRLLGYPFFTNFQLVFKSDIGC